MSKKEPNRSNIWELVNSEDIKPNEKNLHFIHSICSSVFQRKILDKDEPYQLKKFKQTEIYNESEILFLSYGKPCYIGVKALSPVFFYFELKDKEVISEKSEIYALDTGAFLRDLCSYFKGIEEEGKDDVLKAYFKNENANQESIRKFISFFYKDNVNYYGCALQDNKDKKFNFVLGNYLRGIKALNKKVNGEFRLEDWRISSIEMQYFDNINLMNDDVFELKYILCMDDSEAYVKAEFPDTKVRSYGFAAPYGERLNGQESKSLELLVYEAGKEIVKELERK